MEDVNQSYEIALDTLVIMRRMFRSKGHSADVTMFAPHVKSIVSMILKALNHEYSKIISEGLRVAGSFLAVMKGPDGSTLSPSFASDCNPLFEAINEKLEKRDIDQEVKQCSIIAMAHAICVMHKTIPAPKMKGILTVFNDRL